MSSLPDYGAHGAFILASWGASALVLGALIAYSILRARAVEKEMSQAESDAAS